MTNNQHGQVPEALIDLIDAYAETRHRYGRIYNARTEAARNAVIEALSGVQALSAAPEAIAKLRHLYQNMVNGAVRDTASAKRIAEGLLAPAIEALERATPPSEQQAEPGAVDRTGCTAGTDEECTRRGCATSCPAQQAAPKTAPTRTALPEGRTDCTIEFGNDGPEVVAYGPKRMMTRLAKWLGKYFAQVIADAATKAAPQQEAQEPAVDDPNRWFTVVYRDISPDDEARLLAEHPKASAMSWSHAIRDRDAARAVLAKWGTQPQAGAVPQGWKAVPVNPTPEMWKAAKTVPDPNPPYPPHYGLVWDAMLAASPTPPAEKQARPGAVYAELPEPDATTVGLGAVWNRHSMRDFADRTHALRASQGQASSQAGEYPALVCDYCGALTPDPWHSSGMLHGKMSKHIHSCDACAARGAAQAQDTREPLTDEQLAEMMRDTWGCASIAPRHALEFARAVERAHGIAQKGGD